MVTPIKRSHYLWTSLLLLLVLSLGLLSATVQADSFEVSVDRSRLSENETLTLSIKTDVLSLFDSPNLDPLHTDFEVLAQQARTNIQIINGQNRSEKMWEITLLPKRTGTLIIPALVLDKQTSQPITIEVQKAPRNSLQSADVFLHSEIDQQGPIYVQQQLIYTLRLYYATSISDHGLTDLALPDDLLLPLGNRRDYESQLNGRTYSVAEWQFAIYPQRSGELIIPAQTFSGRVRQNSRNYSLGSLKQIRIQSPEHRVQVLPIPDEFAQQPHWLPATSIKLSQKWSGDYSQWQVGTPITRQLLIEAKGLTAAQLPPIELGNLQNLKQYPEPAQQQDTNSAQGFSSQRSVNIALIPTQAGRVTLPAIEIPWWNTNTQRMELARLDEMTIEIQANPNSVAPAEAKPNRSANKPQVQIVRESANLLPWQLFSLSTSIIVLVLAVLFWRQRQQLAQLISTQSAQKTHAHGRTKIPFDNQSSAEYETLWRQHQNELLNLCQQHQAQQAWQAWLRWQQVQKIETSVEFDQALIELQSQLYGAQANPEQWQGYRLLQALKQLSPSVQSSSAQLQPLYPR
ncbi:Oxygen tolerance [Oceanospirillum multiglobuliferum]|uniref:DUF7939 domain-containing protein n=1 Tax=Oceanospirillum multiglobuliferum TaxID=64969 RepID=A0A1T4LHC7_9GAMM|nr:BatD family protein [Oceanospirillum multiglobuliferum]OPX56664.1 hypothetical protein BTE48_01830 [Oceanospirillum multiglobuliferum]SJZ53947.1 Oxygen tolerance [Oceanospirillum multiglobuliferum]